MLTGNVPCPGEYQAAATDEGERYAGLGLSVGEGWPASARAWGKAAVAFGVAPCGRTVVAAMQVGGTMAWQALAHIAGVEPAGAPGRVGEESWQKKRVRHGGLLRWPTERRAAYWSDNGRPTSLRVSERRWHSLGHPDGLLRL